MRNQIGWLVTTLFILLTFIIVGAEEIPKPPGSVADIDNLHEDTILNTKPEPVDLGNTQPIGDEQLIKSEIRRIMLAFGEDTDEVPEVFSDEVKAYIGLFQGNPQFRKFVSASLKRSSKYMQMVKAVLAEKHIPEDMAYIAFIESGYNPLAKSPAGAAGLWQFIPSTARKYSLVVNKQIDERYDAVKSTIAAANYFRDLISIFGPNSFLLSMAAYNSGEGKIISCLKKIDNPFEQRNFWHIRTCLANETREFPPRIIAVAIIGNNPEAFGFIRYKEEEFDYDKWISELKKKESESISLVQRVSENSSQSSKKIHKASSTEHKIQSVKYIVKKGNRLITLSEAFNVNVSEIKVWNRLKSDNLITGQTLIIYPTKPLVKISYKVNKNDSITDIAEAYGVRPSHIITVNGLKNGYSIKKGQSLEFYTTMKYKTIYYTVKKGNNLTNIAHKFNVPVKNIAIWNGLASNEIQPNMRLKIYKATTNDA